MEVFHINTLILTVSGPYNHRHIFLIKRALAKVACTKDGIARSSSVQSIRHTEKKHNTAKDFLCRTTNKLPLNDL